MTTHEQCVKAMADALLDSGQANAGIDEYSVIDTPRGQSDYSIAIKLIVDVIKADPLRKVLGPKAVEAILKGEAAVVPFGKQEAAELNDTFVKQNSKGVFGAHFCADGYEINCVLDRLDTPEGGAIHE